MGGGGVKDILTTQEVPDPVYKWNKAQLNPKTQNQSCAELFSILTAH